VGLTGQDAAFITVKQWKNAEGHDLGFVGDITHVDTDLLKLLLSQDFIPVIAPIAVDLTGQAYNVNADLVAGAVAGALQAKKLMVLTDVNGLYADIKDPSTRIPLVQIATLQTWLDEGQITGGMVPKLQACINALRQGVGSAQIIDGKMPQSLLSKTDIGTTITA
jgi:acetylglutamate kinase